MTHRVAILVVLVVAALATEIHVAAGNGVSCTAVAKQSLYFPEQMLKEIQEEAGGAGALVSITGRFHISPRDITRRE